jgi:hypothetical protein
MVLPPLGTGVDDPHKGLVFPYPYLLHPGTCAVQGNHVSPGGRFKIPLD